MRRYQDRFGRLAKKQGYPARSVFKLQEIDRRLKLFAKGQRVLDLGASPGSWLLYASEQVGAGGAVVGIDLQELNAELPANTQFFPKDIFALDLAAFKSEYGPFQVVLSDMAPHTSGNRQKDQYLSFELFMRALQIAEQVLTPSGSFVGKIFQGPEFEQARSALTAAFSTTRILKPEASRKESYEIFLFGRIRAAGKGAG
jgi:23S rRNA (uridine2552-2'-O)-methyltransferase